MDTSNENIVVENFEFLSRFGNELQALTATLNEKILKSLASEGNDCWALSGKKAIEDDDLDDSGFFYQGTSWCLPITRRPKRNTLRYVGYQISLFGGGIQLQTPQSPLIHVLCWEVPVQFNSEGPNVNFPMEFSNKLRVEGDRLCVWGEESRDWTRIEWMYSLRLMQLRRPADLDAYIVAPIVKLLQGKDSAEALPAEWFESVLVRLPKEQEFIH